jgi:hypothetical protein
VVYPIIGSTPHALHMFGQPDYTRETEMHRFDVYDTWETEMHDLDLDITDYEQSLKDSVQDSKVSEHPREHLEDVNTTSYAYNDDFLDYEHLDGVLTSPVFTPAVFNASKLHYVGNEGQAKSRVRSARESNLGHP